MDIKRTILYIALAAVGAMLWAQWQHEYRSTPETSSAPTASTIPVNQETSSSGDGHYVPTPNQASHVDTTASGAAVTRPRQASTDFITVKTDKMTVFINPVTGDLVGANLPDYPVSLSEHSQPVRILSDDLGGLYEMQGGVISKDRVQVTNFHASQAKYQLLSGENQLTVTLTGTAGDLTVQKIYVFSRGKYDATLTTRVINRGKQDWSGQFYQQIVRQNVPSSTHHIRSYDGAAISSPKTPYQKVSFKDMDHTPVRQEAMGGWIAMQQPYFLTAWVPPASKHYDFYSHVEVPKDGGASIYTIGYMGKAFSVASGATESEKSVLYVGPEISENLKPLAPGLNLTIDYGWLSPVSSIIFSVMNDIHRVVGNWGWSVILVTLLIKVLFYWPSAQSYKSMAKMRAVQPRLVALKERFGDDKAALSKATMEFYKKEKVNPMGGCLPMLIQIPVFFALYYVLIESVQLRQAPFIFWIHDLSVKDPYYIFPILMGISMFLQQRLSPAPADPTQAKMMMLMPVVFTVVFLSFPAGLVLYWLTNNVLSISQQWYVMRTFDSKKASKRKR